MRILVLLCLAACLALAKAEQLPNGWAWGCRNISKSLPFCDTKLSYDQRLEDLLKRLDRVEKLSLIGADKVSTGVNDCNCMDAGLERLGIPKYMHLVETNSAVASACISENKCATEFPGPTGLAASFNRSMWRHKGEVLSDEMRAFNNLGWHRGMEGDHSKIGLTGFGPNINIVRDPRFGRNSELPSEDPFLTGTYAVEYVKGCQEGNDPNYMKMMAGLKHYAAYSVEKDRSSFIPTVSMFDLWDTYLPQYKMAFRPEGGNAAAVMCSYAGINGVPSCANDYLLNQVVRDKWERPDVLVASDCGAIENMEFHNHYALLPWDAAAKSLNGGTDLDMGDMYYPPLRFGGNEALTLALDFRLTDEAHVDQAVGRSLLKRFEMGQFDPLEQQPYTRIGLESINSTTSHGFVLDATYQTLVLLKNDNQTLPFSKDKTVAIVGPHIVSQRDLFEDYKGDAECLDGSDNCVRTLAEVFTTMHGASRVFVAKGVDLDSQDAKGINAALDACRAADQVVLAIGIGYTQEHESIDRTLINLPGLQSTFALRVLALHKPTVIVLINGGMLGIDELVQPAPAILEAFYPGMRGAEAIYRTIFGEVNRFGRMPVTIYPSNFVEKQQMNSFDMTVKPGRTYRYYQDKPLYPFGFGLSYTTFAFTCTAAAAHANANLTHVDCKVLNTGTREGDVVLLVYHRAGTDIRSKVTHPVPTRSLVEFTRMGPIQPNQWMSVPGGFDLDWSAKFTLTNAQGDKVLYSGMHYVEVSDGSDPNKFVTLPIVVPAFGSNQQETAIPARVIDHAPRMPFKPVF